MKTASYEFSMKTVVWSGIMLIAFYLLYIVGSGIGWAISEIVKLIV